MLDRVDNDKGYYKGNCKWSTRREQNNNTRSNRIVIIDGEEMTLAQAAEKAGMNYKLVKARVSKGWELHKALSTPPKGKD